MNNNLTIDDGKRILSYLPTNYFVSLSDLRSMVSVDKELIAGYKVSDFITEVIKKEYVSRFSTIFGTTMKVVTVDPYLSIYNDGKNTSIGFSPIIALDNFIASMVDDKDYNIYLSKVCADYTEQYENCTNNYQTKSLIMDMIQVIRNIIIENNIHISADNLSKLIWVNTNPLDFIKIASVDLIDIDNLFNYIDMDKFVAYFVVKSIYNYEYASDYEDKLAIKEFLANYLMSIYVRTKVNVEDYLNKNMDIPIAGYRDFDFTQFTEQLLKDYGKLESEVPFVSITEENMMNNVLIDYGYQDTLFRR